jgi:hypothetical protein
MELLIQRTDKVGVSTATTEDIKAYLSEHGYIAALKDPCPTQTEKLFAATCSRDDISDDDLGLVFYQAMLEEFVV